MELFAPCRRAFIFTMPQKVDGYDRQSEGAVRITSNTLSPKGKGRFYEIRTEYRSYSETAMYLCIVKKNGADGKGGMIRINDKIRFDIWVMQ